jgi:hypothetical protein
MRPRVDATTPVVPRRWTWTVLALCTSACQAGFAQDAPTEAASSPDQIAERPARPRSATSAQVLAVGEIASVIAIVSGARDTTYEGSTAAGNVRPAGGCRSDGTLRLGFTFEASDRTPTGAFRWTASTKVETGATGTFPVDSASYWYPRLGSRSRTTYWGAGSLEISRHDARPQARRMTGRLVAQGLTDSGGEAVDIDVSFDIGGSCGVSN